MSLRVGVFTEVYHPVHNGVVASVDMLRTVLRDDARVTTFAPAPACDAHDDDDVVRLPSLPLPTSSGYRLCVPFATQRVRRCLRNLDIVHAHTPFVTGWFALAHARRSHVPLIYTYHTQFHAYAHYAPFERHASRAALVALTRAFANRADVVIAPTAAMRDRLRELRVTSRIEIVPTPIDVRRYAGGVRSRAVRALLGAHTDDDRVVLVVARLGREKNVELAVDALAHAPGARLAVVGAGPRRTALERRARRRGVAARVRFTGALPAAALPDVYAAADVFAFTSVTDTQGLVLAEAAAAGLPIVAIDSLVAREVTGGAAIFPANSPRAFGAALMSGRRSPPTATLDPVPAFRRRLLDLYESV